MRHLLNILELSTEEIDRLIATADDIMDAPEKYQNACSGKILATLFFEPSTRTRLSFESAMLGLGGKVLGFSDSSSSSAKKGESVADTIAVASAYADIIAMRHPKEGAPLVASLHSRVPIINGGDGGHYHPTQTLTDLLTIRHEKGRFDGLTVGLCGDLKFGRTVHSLIEALSRYAGVRFVLISPKELELPPVVREEYIEKKSIPCKVCRSLEEAMGELDILYMTRIQRERFACEEDYQRLKDSYILTPEKLGAAKPDCIVMHPLPRVNEIDVRVDNDPRACYFREVHPHGPDPHAFGGGEGRQECSRQGPPPPAGEPPARGRLPESPLHHHHRAGTGAMLYPGGERGVPVLLLRDQGGIKHRKTPLATEPAAFLVTSISF